tara:strand:- start:91 stop:237 length:147 start_codon:yes stop_codon:yes gene_type:complete
MRLLLPLAILFLSSGCVKKTRIKMDEVRIIERDTDILTEEDLEELPEN